MLNCSIMCYNHIDALQKIFVKSGTNRSKTTYFCSFRKQTHFLKAILFNLRKKNSFINVFWLDMSIECMFVTLWNVLFLDQWNGDTANRRRTPETQQQSQHA